MDRRYSLKPYASTETPNFKWAVSGPNDDGSRRWRRLFETRTEAESFLREKQAGPKGAILVKDQEVVGERPPMASVPSRETPREASRRFRKRGGGQHIGGLRIAILLAAVISAAFFIDQALRRKPVGLAKDVLLSENFAANPILSGWTTSHAGTDWAPDAQDASDRAIMVQSGTWSGPLLETKPLQWYRLAFKSKAPGKVVDPGGVGYGYCFVNYFDAAGEQLSGDDVSPILQSADWRWNELRVRARLVIGASGGVRPTKMKVVFTPVGGQPFFVDDLTIEKVSAREVVGWADEVYTALPARLDYQPKASRWERIPETIRKLREGLPLRVVMLGDSVQQDLANSPFDALLQRQFPNSQVEVIASTKSGTGVEFFQDHVPEFITKYRPDLLVIGGISNGGGIPAFQATVDGVRASDVVAGRKTEIMIVTRPWSPNVSPSQPNAFFLTPGVKELDQNTTDVSSIPDDDRGQLLRFAQASGVEFLDMTGIVSEFIHGPAKAAGFGPPNSPDGTPYSFWMRDWVHPNGAGRQIMGRILTQYFLPERTGSLRREDFEALAK